MNRHLWSCLGTAFLAVMVVSAFTLTGCGKDTSSDKGGGKSGASSGGGDSGAASGGEPGKAGTATISGKVTFKGTPPANGNINMQDKPNCAKQHPDGAKEQVYCVGADGGLQWVLVSVLKGDVVVGKSWPTTPNPVSLDQHGCMYEPHVFGVMVNQQICIKNSDEELHNINAQGGTKNKGFNDSQGAGAPVMNRSFDKVEAWIPVKCDVHSWMHCFCGVFSHPYFAVSDAQGAYSIGNLPAGKYTLRAQHEKAGKVEHDVEVKEGEKATLDFEFPGK